jgi:hypothetical protein
MAGVPRPVFPRRTGGSAMRVRISTILVLVCLLGLSLPVMAKSLSAKMNLSQPTKIVNVELKPGQYNFIADTSTGVVKVEHKYKVVAKVKGRWVKLSKKADLTEVLTNGHNIQEIQFAGKDTAIKF